MIDNKFLETVNEYDLISPKDHVLVGVSGGVDSIALLHLLNSHREKLGITLHIAHIDHRIRKGEAEMDLRYVQNIAQGLRIPLTVESVDVPAYAAENKMSMETAARQVRYGFFERVAKQIGATRIAVGHNADDNVETFLMRLLRGAGIKGLCGIPPKRGKIIRPLIKIWRREIEAYVGGLKLVPRRDHTNYESKYMRNRVRMKLVPQLKIYNLNIKEIILQTILLLTEDSLYLESQAEQALAKALLSENDSELCLDTEKLLSQEYSMKGHVIREAIEKTKGDLMEFSYKHVRDIIGNLSKKGKWEMHLPDGIFVRGESGKMIISRQRPEKAKAVSFRYSLTLPGEVEIKETGKKLRASLVEDFDPDRLGDSSAKVAFVDYSTLGKNLLVRNRAEGDRFYPLGMKGSKKIQDLFVDEKVPLEMRDLVPIVESRGAIVWVGGLRLDERAKVTKRTKKAVKLELL